MKKGLQIVVSSWTLFFGVLVPAAGVTAPRLVVNVNNVAGFDQATLAKAEQMVTAIFQDAGVQIEWQSARDPGIVQAGLGSSSAQHGLRINIVAIRPTAMGGRKEEVGFAALPGDGQPGFLAWVFEPTLEKIIDDAQYLTHQRVRSVLLKVVLGHVIAHEMGHLLLGSAEHSGSGIMTLGWDLRKVRLACTGSLRFSPKQSGKIRARVEAMNNVHYASASRAPR